MEIESLITFALAFVVFAAAPGPDNITIFAKTLSSGKTAGISYALGVVSSVFVFVILASLGLNLIAQYVSEYLILLQYFGGAYLIYLGVSTWRRDLEFQETTKEQRLIQLFILGFVLNVTNPKMPIFYLALLPVIFINPVPLSDTLMLLILIGFIEFFVIGFYVLIAHNLKRAATNSNVFNILNKSSAGLMIVVGLVVIWRSIIFDWASAFAIKED